MCFQCSGHRVQKLLWGHLCLFVQSFKIYWHQSILYATRLVYQPGRLGWQMDIAKHWEIRFQYEKFNIWFIQVGFDLIINGNLLWKLILFHGFSNFVDILFGETIWNRNIYQVCCCSVMVMTSEFQSSLPGFKSETMPLFYEARSRRWAYPSLHLSGVLHKWLHINLNKLHPESVFAI